jgi:hypothetical protein
MLTSVGGDLIVNGSAKLDALTSVGGYLSVYGSAKLDAPLLTEENTNCQKTREFHTSNTRRLQANIAAFVRQSFLSLGFLFADGILAKIESKKTQGEVVIYTCTVNGGQKTIYCVQRGETFSHGDTVEKAIADLRYKISDRDTEQYKEWKIEDEKPIEEIIQAYRVITGACESGTRMFCESQSLPEAMKLKVAVRMTKGQFGHEEFKEFFK